MKVPNFLFALYTVMSLAVSAQVKTETDTSIWMSKTLPSGYTEKYNAEHSPLHHIISTNIADLALQKWNLQYEYLSTNSKWRTKDYLFVDVKDKNYGLGLAAYSNWKISKHVEHYIGGQFLGEWIDSFYEDLYLKYRPRGFSIAPRFSTGVAFTVWKRLHLGIEGNIGPGFVFREQRFKGTYLSVGLGANVGVKF